MALTPALIVRMPAPALRGAAGSPIDVNINLVWHDPVRFVVTTGPLASIVNGATYDGLTVATGDPFLYQPVASGAAAAGISNGIYIAGVGAPTRRATEDTGAELLDAAVLVMAGINGAGTSWVCVNPTALTIGTDPITFRQFDAPTSSAALFANGVTALRAMPASNGSSVRLNYHTTAGDLGSGIFRGVTGAAVGTYVDNGGTIIVPTGGDGSAAWLRVWDGLQAHVGWWGAKCDRVTDDYAAVYKAISLFTDGRTATRSGALAVGPGFAFGTPIVIGGAPGTAFRLLGEVGLARTVTDGSFLKYIGPATPAAIILYGANETDFDNINVDPGLAYNGVLVTAANTYNQTLAASVSIGVDVVATASSTAGLVVGSYIGIDAGGVNFEVVYVTAVSSPNFTATFTKNHASGVQIGNSAGSSGVKFHACMLRCPAGPVNTTLTAPVTGSAGAVFTPVSMAGIQVGMPIRIGTYSFAEVVYPTAITATTFTANSVITHNAGDPIMYATSAVLLGNRLSSTVQVSEMVFDLCYLVGTSPVTTQYAGVRQIQGGNVKNFNFSKMKYAYLKVPFAFESASGIYAFNGVIGVCEDTIFLQNGGAMIVDALEDESAGAMMLRGTTGTSMLWATFIGASVQVSRPTTDLLVQYTGALTLIGCDLRNTRVAGTSFPIIRMDGIRSSTNPTSSLVAIDTYFERATDTSAFVIDAASADILNLGDGRVSLINCTGGIGGAIVRLSSVFPPSLLRWQNTATYDPPSLAAGTVAPVQTMTITGAALGDIVEVTFDKDLQGIALRAWVSAANTVSYQFFNPTGGSTVDLASGTVKCRLKK